MGLNNLIQAASREKKNISQAANKKDITVREQETAAALPLPSPGPETSECSKDERPAKEELETPVKTEMIRQQEIVPEKKRRGRPSFKEKGKTVRKQYTLTLEAKLYGLILEKAESEKISFAKYMERAALEYMERHGK